MKNRNYLLAAAMGIALCAASSAFAGSADTASSTSASSSPFSSLEAGTKQWWNGTSALGNWFGLGYPLADHGLTISGEAKETFIGQLTGGLPNTQKGNWVNEEKIKAQLDLEKILGLEGITIESNWRYRNVDGSQNAPYTAFAAGTAGPSSMFNPDKDTSGMGVRIMTQFLQWQSEKGKDPLFMVKFGWVNPYEDFLQQPLSKFFQNNAIASAKGIGGANGPGVPVWSTTQNKYINYGTTGVPWGSSYATWGGSLRAKPSSTTYVQSGLYLAIGGYAGTQNSAYLPTDVYPYKNLPANMVGTVKQGGYQPYDSVNYQGNTVANGQKVKYNVGVQNNHGFNFQGAANFNPNGDGGNYTQNGVYNVNEFGWMPKLGADKLEGKYVVGSYIWGQNNTSYSSSFNAAGSNPVKTPIAYMQNYISWGMYFQADQRLYAAKEDGPAAPAPSGKNPVDSKNPVVPTQVASKTKGLYMFNEFTFTPAQNNAVPFYFQTGLVYKGLIPKRDLDSCGIALGAGFYSSYLNSYTQSQNQALVNNYGSAANATVPNGPVSASPADLGSGASTKQASYYAYAPNYSSTEVLEAFYNVQVNKWLTVRPDVQYLINPAGNGTVGNEWILGCEVACKF